MVSNNSIILILHNDMMAAPIIIGSYAYERYIRVTYCSNWYPGNMDDSDLESWHRQNFQGPD